MHARKQRKRVIAILLAVTAAAGLAVGAFGNRWLAPPAEDASSYFDDRSVGMGLRSYERCASTCTSVTNFELIDLVEADIKEVEEYNLTVPAKEQRPLPRRPWHGFPVVGMLTFGFALLAAAGLIAGVLLALAGKRITLPIMPTTLAVLGLAGGIICGCIFIATKPDLPDPLIVGWSFIVFGAGAVVGLAAVFPLNRAIRPIDAELGEAASTMSWGGSRDD
jgi:hypothetical protein